MIQVGRTGLFLDGGQKGNFEIILLSGKIFRGDKLLDGCNVDCSGEIFRAIKEYGNFKVDAKRFLKNHEWLIKECFKEQLKGQEAWSMGKCHKCGVNQKCNEERYCFPLGVNSDWDVCTAPDEDMIVEDKHVLTATAPIRYIKDFDLRSEYVYGLHMICKIKKIDNPIVRKGKYYQEGVFYDTDTSKTLDFMLEDGVADYDTWHPGNKVEAWGIYENGFYYVTSMELVDADTSEPIPISRDAENPGYTKWRNRIINRDQKCVCCGFDKHLEAHHLFGYKENPSLAINESNGVTLCKFCHDKYHSVYGLRDINPVDFVEFIKRFGV